MLQVFGHGKTTVRKASPWKFAYIGGTKRERGLESIQTLQDLAIGDRARVSGYEGNEGIQDFQRSGLTIGVEIRVLSRKPSGSMVIQLSEGRIGVGAGVVDRIQVQLFQ
jgi:ferrous iron transport protein A